MSIDVSVIEKYCSSLDSSIERLLRAVEPLTPEQARQDSGGDEWSVVKVLAHVAEMLPYWAHQAEDVIARDSPTAPFGRTHDDPRRIAAVEAAAGGDVRQLAARVRDAAAEGQQVVRGLPAAYWTRAGQHPRRGQMTVTDIVDQFMVQHAAEHADQAESLAAAVSR